MKKLIALLLFTLIFSAAGISGSPGEKMTFKPGIAFVQGQIDVQVIAPQGVKSYQYLTGPSYIPLAPFKGGIKNYARVVQDGFKDYLITNKGRHVDKTLMLDRSFTIGSNSTTTTRIATDAETYLNQRKFLIYSVYNRTWRRS